MCMISFNHTTILYLQKLRLRFKPLGFNDSSRPISGRLELGHRMASFTETLQLTDTPISPDNNFPPLSVAGSIFFHVWLPEQPPEIPATVTYIFVSSPPHSTRVGLCVPRYGRSDRMSHSRLHCEILRVLS